MLRIIVIMLEQLVKSAHKISVSLIALDFPVCMRTL